MIKYVAIRVLIGVLGHREKEAINLTQNIRSIVEHNIRLLADDKIRIIYDPEFERLSARYARRKNNEVVMSI